MMDFFGIAGASFFIGVVEDRNDDMGIGRVRVRIPGLHSEKKVEDDDSGEGIPTDKLPWAFPMTPITSAAMSGIGDAPVGPVEGTWVVGISRDGELMNDLIYIGTLGGVPKEYANPNVGFNDPNGVYPKYINEPDTNRLARGVSEGTIVKTKKANVEKNVDTGQGTWSEPATPFNAQYPYNHVSESESGHIHEVDDTEGAERIHRYHKAGTFEEIHPDGTRVIKIIGDDYEIAVQDRNVLVKGNLSITVNQDANIHVKSDANIKVDGNVSETVGGDMTSDVSGNVTVNANGDATVKATSVDIEASGEVNITGSKIGCNGGTGVITGESICHFTGQPHLDKSLTVTAEK